MTETRESELFTPQDRVNAKILAEMIVMLQDEGYEAYADSKVDCLHINQEDPNTDLPNSFIRDGITVEKISEKMIYAPEYACSDSSADYLEVTYQLTGYNPQR